MEKIAVNVEGLTKRFGRKAVVEHCTFSIAQGAIFGLVGKNGAGKTTLIRLLLGLLKPDAGVIAVSGFNPWLHEQSYYRSLGVALENDGFSGNLTIQENLKLYAAAKGLTWTATLDYIRHYWAETVIGAEIAGKGKKAKYLSRGQRVQCGLCRAFLGWPSVYFLDEPTVALDVQGYEHFCAMTREARNRGATMLISSHQLSTIEELCDEVGILDNRRLHDVHKGAEEPVQQWTLVADYSSEHDNIIEHCIGPNAEYADGAWRFSIENSDTIIPQLITKLAAAGCCIREVRREKQELKDAIKAHYESSDSRST